MCRMIVRALLALFPIGALQAQSLAWTDPSPHQVRMISITPSVRLEVLDWGGSGPAMVFLAGLGNTAHSFDDFAPRFRDQYHVYAITRRGFGESSRPDSGYDATTRARDIVTVLDSLRAGQAILVGHSIAGDELSKVASSYPERVRALVYLEAYDYGPDKPNLQKLGVRLPPQALQPMTTTDSASAHAVAAYMKRTFGFALPDGEIHTSYFFGPDGRLTRNPVPRPISNASSKVSSATERSAYAMLTAPALAIYTVIESPAQFFPNYGNFDAENRSLAQRFVETQVQWMTMVRERFRAEVKRGTVIEIPGAHHYIYTSHDAQVELAMRAFLARL